MQFTFVRDEEGFESIQADGVRLAVMAGPERWALASGPPNGVEEHHIIDAIEFVQKDGFWRIGKPGRVTVNITADPT